MIEMAFHGLLDKMTNRDPFEPPPPPVTPESEAKVVSTLKTFFRSFRQHRVVKPGGTV